MLFQLPDFRAVMEGSNARVHLEGDPLSPHALAPRELKELLEVERRGHPFLALRGAENELKFFVLENLGGTSTIGRRAESSLSISWDREVSGLHAELELLAGEVTIIDDGLSTNGTFVNGRRVAGRQRLRDRDLVRVGQTALAFRGGERTGSQPTAVAADTGQLVQLTDTQRRLLVALCRPYGQPGGFTTPATNQQIAKELFLSTDTVKTHLRGLFARFELSDLPQNQKRTRLAELALQLGLVTRADFG